MKYRARLLGVKLSPGEFFSNLRGSEMGLSSTCFERHVQMLKFGYSDPHS